MRFSQAYPKRLGEAIVQAWASGPAAAAGPPIAATGPPQQLVASQPAQAVAFEALFSSSPSAGASDTFTWTSSPSFSTGASDATSDDDSDAP